MLRALRFGTLAVAGVLAGCLIGTATAQAVPVNPAERVELTQPSGDSFTAKPFGDEWYHGYRTLDGYTVVEDPRSK